MAVACFAGGEIETQAQGELEYAGNLSAVVWHDSSADDRPKHEFTLLYYSKRGWHRGDPVETRQVAFFDHFPGGNPKWLENSDHIELSGSLGNEFVFYVRTDTTTKQFFLKER